MLASFPIIIAFLIVAGVPPLRLSRKLTKIHWWDYALPATGLPVWMFLVFAEVGETPSLSNLVLEVVIILIVSILVPWLRFFVLHKNENVSPVFYRIMYFVPFIVAIFIRVFMPTLPE